MVDGYAWSMSIESNTNDTSAFEQVAARQLVLDLSQERNQFQLAQLDAIHAIAKNSGIVTPYSSMIVLVNAQQKQALNLAEAQSDRFKRQVESGQEQLTQPFNPFTVSATPEPEEWMLMGLGALALLFIAKRRRGARREIGWAQIDATRSRNTEEVTKPSRRR